MGSLEALAAEAREAEAAEKRAAEEAKEVLRLNYKGSLIES